MYMSLSSYTRHERVMSNVRRTGIVLHDPWAYAGCVDVRSHQGLPALESLAGLVASRASLLGRPASELFLLTRRLVVADGGDGLLELSVGRHANHLLTRLVELDTEVPGRALLITTGGSRSIHARPGLLT